MKAMSEVTKVIGLQLTMREAILLKNYLQEVVYPDETQEFTVLKAAIISGINDEVHAELPPGITLTPNRVTDTPLPPATPGAIAAATPKVTS